MLNNVKKEADSQLEVVRENDEEWFELYKKDSNNPAIDPSLKEVFKRRLLAER